MAPPSRFGASSGSSAKKLWSVRRTATEETPRELDDGPLYEAPTTVVA